MPVESDQPPADRRGAPLRVGDVVLIRAVVLSPDPGGPFPGEIVVQVDDPGRTDVFLPVFALDAGLVERAPPDPGAGTGFGGPRMT